MRIKMTFFVLVSAAAVLLSLTGAFDGQVSRAEMQEILSAPLLFLPPFYGGTKGGLRNDERGTMNDER